jgi:hypothetical protein
MMSHSASALLHRGIEESPAEVVSITDADLNEGRRRYGDFQQRGDMTVQDAFVMLAAHNAALRRGIRERNAALQREAHIAWRADSMGPTTLLFEDRQ